MMPKQIYKGTNWEQQPLGLFAEIQATEISDEMTIEDIDDLDFENWLFSNFHEISWKKEDENQWRIKGNRKEMSVKMMRRIGNDISLSLKYISVSFYKKYEDHYGWGCPCDTLAEVKKMIERGLKDLNER